MSETTLWNWLKRARVSLGPALHIQRIENGVSTGNADVDGVFRGRDFAIELKAGKKPARANSRLDYHKVTDVQAEWHSDRLAAGGASCFLIQVGEERWLVHGSQAHILQIGVTYQWLTVRGQRVFDAAGAIYSAIAQRSAKYP